MVPIFVGCAVLVLTQIGFAQGQKIDRDAEKPGPIVIELVLSRTIVGAIDYGKRPVTLKLPDGTPQTLKAEPEVKNVDQGKVGTLDHTMFIESIAVFIGTPNSSTRTKPGDAASNPLLLTAKVDTIDHAHRTVTLKSPQGNLKTLSVGGNVANFILMKEGDQVVVRSR
jgi:hypothetical protein